MCGIAGIVGQIDDRNRDALGRMERAIAHRGPDSTGIWTSKPDAAGVGCMLAHRRLSILDLSHAATQPMIDPATGQVIVFNGEIYNYVGLRKSLESEGEQFQSTGDTAVMLRLLARHGHDAIRKLRGMFAFALWDDAKRTLVVGRDPLGIKPLFLCQNPDPNGSWRLLFASELRSIIASGLIGRPTLNPEAVASVLWNGFVFGPATCVRGVELMNAGEVRLYNGAGQKKLADTYWTIHENAREPGSVSEEEMAETLRESVRLHLASDVPLGVFLSGGVDSGAVANLAQKVSDSPIHTFTLAFEDPELNEGQHAREIAQAIGTTHREILLTEKTFVDNIDAALDTLDQPTFDGLNSFYMSKAVREAGLTVALVGTGGDELFGGYTTFRDLPQMLSWNHSTRMVPRSAKVAMAKVAAMALAGKGGIIAPQTRWAKLPDMVDGGADVFRLYQLAYSLFRPGFQTELMTTGLVNGNMYDGMPRGRRNALNEEIQGMSPLRAIAALEQRCFLGERLLRDSDAASMAVSLELRLPLVDHIMVEMANGLEEESRFQPIRTKSMLRRIGLVGLDPKLFDRPKRGFVLPYDRWIKQTLGEQMDATMRDTQLAASVGLNGKSITRLWDAYRSGQKGLYWSRVWAVYVLMRWCQRHGVML